MSIGNWWSPSVDSIGNFFFFRLILDFLDDRIKVFGIEMLGRVMGWVGMIALMMLTIWILVQGVRIVSGQSRDSMMALVMNSLRATLIVSVATTMSLLGSDLHQGLTEAVPSHINWLVTGEDRGPGDVIDENLGWMQVALSSIDVIDVAGDETLDVQKTRALYMVGFGTGGPAIVGGTMLLLNRIAMAIFIGLGPIFILCLLFDQTKPLFGRWLYYGLGTMFSMAVLSGMVAIALDMVSRVAKAFWGTAILGTLLNSNFSDGMSSQALQQGGLGLILTTLIISAPPMAASFFQGTMGHFTPASVFGDSGSGRDSTGRYPGQAGYLPNATGSAPVKAAEPTRVGSYIPRVHTPSANPDLIKSERRS